MALEVSEVLIIVLVMFLVLQCSGLLSKSKDKKPSERYVNDRMVPECLTPYVKERMVPERLTPYVKEQYANPNDSNLNAERAEGRSTIENIEAFATCGTNNNETDRALDCLCGDNPDITFAVNEFGAPGLDYKAFTATQEIDPEVVKNHAQFVKERGGFTGRTFSPDSHDSYDPIPWIGLRRPEYVKVCNPTQVPDVDYNLYKSNRQFCFKT